MLQDKARFTDDLLAKLLAMALNLPTGMGQKLKYGLQKHAENAKKSPQLSMRVREFLGAASRNRTGTGLTPGDFKRETSKVCCNPNSRISVYFPHLNNILV